MWTIVGAFAFIQFALIKLTIDINQSWRVRFYFIILLSKKSLNLGMDCYFIISCINVISFNSNMD
jgi:hypothetical protein